MKERKIGRIIILCAFVVIICCSKGVWFFAEKKLDSANYENRQMATRPLLTIDSYKTFSKDYTSFFNDNLQFRKSLISLNSCIDYFIFDRSASNQVIKGHDGWLFYKDTLADFQGTNLYTKDELESIKNNVIKAKQFFNEKGIEFVIFIGPNKNTIYGDYMPQNYLKENNESRISQMVNYLQENTDVKIIFPVDDLKTAREKYPNYYYYFHCKRYYKS